MNKVLRKYLEKFVEVYLDDIIIYSRTKEEYTKHMRAVVQKIREVNLKLKLIKCKWFEQELIFVKHRITAKGIESDPRNIEKIKNARVSNSTIKLRGFLRTAQFYKQFVKDYADIARSIYDMLKDDVTEYWENTQQVAFDTLKEKLTSMSIRAHSNFNKPFKLYMNASDMGLKAVLA